MKFTRTSKRFSYSNAADKLSSWLGWFKKVGLYSLLAWIPLLAIMQEASRASMIFRVARPLALIVTGLRQRRDGGDEGGRNSTAHAGQS